MNKLGRYAEGEELCRKAIEIDVLPGNAHKNLGLSLQGLGRHDEAAHCFVRSVRTTDGKDPRGVTHLEELLGEHPDVELRLPGIRAELEELREMCRRARTPHGTRA